METKDGWDPKHFDAHICTAEEITEDLTKGKHLYLCPPADKIYFQNHFNLFPAKFLGFEVKPNYDGVGDEESKDKKVAEAAKAAKEAINKKVNMFQMSRSQVNSVADLKSIGGNPIRKQVKLLGRI
jgi:hypothetical protein